MTDTLHIFLWIITILLIIGGVDDIIMDILYLISRKKYSKRRYDINLINGETENPVAIIIGAWKEHRVIARTINYAIRNLKYKNYRIFVGIYPNDKKSLSILNLITEHDNRVVVCVNNKNGPTTKADNLNNIYKCVKLYENWKGEEFKIIVVHDSEDFIHGFSLKLYNYLITLSGYDAVQIPVYPKKDEKGKLIHKTYCDSFAELHSKDMIIRQVYNAFIPLAGTGMAFSRKVFTYLENNYPNLFNEYNLTEDYELGLRLHKLGFKVLFMNTPDFNNCNNMVATSEFFPNNFWAAVKQRSRWIAGICFQNWKLHKWEGSLKTKYFLFRDRKSVFNHLITLLSQTIFVMVLINEIFIRFFNNSFFNYNIEYGSVLWLLLVSCLFLMVNRLIHRFIFTFNWYGLKYAVLSTLRILVDNLINFFATLRAIKVFFNTRKKVVWDSTAHY